MKAIFFVGINFRGFCTQNKVCGLNTLYFQHNKFHWVADLRESFNTLDRCQTASQVSSIDRFLISWTSLPMKVGTPQIKVIPKYCIGQELNQKLVK